MDLLYDVTFTLMQIVLHKVFINDVYYDVTLNSFILVKQCKTNKMNQRFSKQLQNVCNVINYHFMLIYDENQNN